MSLNQPVVMEPRQVVRALRIIWAVILISQFLYMATATRIHAVTIFPLEQRLQMIIAMMGVATAAIVLGLRYVRIAGLISPPDPIDAQTRAKRALTTYIACYVLCESISLYGFVVAFLRGAPKFYVPLYLGGVLLMILCYPRLPSEE